MRISRSLTRAVLLGFEKRMRASSHRGGLLARKEEITEKKEKTEQTEIFEQDLQDLDRIGGRESQIEKSCQSYPKLFHFSLYFRLFRNLSVFSLISESDHRIYLRSPARRKVASRERYDGERKRDEGECQRIIRGYPEQQFRHDTRHSESPGQPGAYTDGRQPHPLSDD